VHAPELLTDRLAVGGRMICARLCDGGQQIVAFDKSAEGVVEAALFPGRLQPIVPGVASSL
jgi:protein-L-isoaspartate O-methyltransferase